MCEDINAKLQLREYIKTDILNNGEMYASPQLLINAFPDANANDKLLAATIHAHQWAKDNDCHFEYVENHKAYHFTKNQ